jgi:predicted ATPase
MASNNWYVITGAPHAGKSTLIRLFKAKGYETRDEAARVYIDREMAVGKTLAEIRGNELAFQQEILKMKVEWEKEAASEKSIFWDRAIPDTEAYYNLLGVALDEVLIKALADCRYQKAFLLDYFPYNQDYARVETEAEQIKLHDLLAVSYRRLGIPVIEVAKMNSDEERLEFILNNLQ